MRFLLGLLVFPPLIWSQPCAPRLTLQPAAGVSGVLSRENCRMADNTAYVEYSLVLPARGEISLEGASSDFALTLFLRDGTGHRIASGASVRTPVERGAYSVVVNAARPEESGAFTLRSAFTPEPGIFCRGFAGIGLNSSVSGRLTEASCRLPDGSLYDGYALGSFGAGSLVVKMSADGFGAWVIVRTADGRELASSDGEIEVEIEGNQTYTIVASASDGGSGAYRLAVSFTPAGNEICRPLKNFQVTDSVGGNISAESSCPFPTADPNVNIFYNYYTLEIAEHGVAEFRLTAPDFNPYLQLLDSSGGLIQADAYGGGIGNAVVKQQLRPGTYILQVFSVDKPGAYTLRYTFTPQMPGDGICPVNEVEAGRPAAGVLSETNCRTAEGASQVYGIVMPRAGTLELDMQSGDFVPLLSLRDAKDNRIVNDDNFGNITNSHITADLPAGTYTVVAATGGLPGGYTFTWQVTPHEPAACAQAQRIELNGAFVGVFGGSSCRGANGQPIDYYQFTTPAEGTVAVAMTSPVIDGLVRLQTADGTPLRWDDNSYGGFDPFLVQFLPGQTYRLAVQATDAIATGYYRLDVLYAAGPRPAGCGPLQAIGSGDSVQGTLTFTACQYADDTFADIYRLEVAEDTGLDLRLNATEFDPHLIVLDGKGNVVDEDDNSGGERNALVSYTFPPGVYFVVAKPFSGYTSTGKYTLAVAPAQ
jgi:hypothetical protein